ncbi:hypothetical protein GAPWK_0582 [Gilliamella apicola]|nr:hypothetical protein GAPWK_0582 [Gilliamella apicola]
MVKRRKQEVEALPISELVLGKLHIAISPFLFYYIYIK